MAKREGRTKEGEKERGKKEEELKEGKGRKEGGKKGSWNGMSLPTSNHYKPQMRKR